MKYTCSVCHSSFDCVPSENNGNSPFLKDVCISCESKIHKNSSHTLKDFLESLNVPVLAVNEEGLVIMANEHLAREFSQDLEKIKGKKGGEVLNCPHAFTEEGCGRSVHCDGCTIRNLVMDCHKTGNSHYNVRAFRELQTEDGIKQYSCLITTEKVKDIVFVSIENVTPIN